MLASSDNVATSSLGRYAKYVSISDDQKLLKWALQAESRAIMPNEVVAKCLRVPHACTVDLLHDQEHNATHYGGLITCGSVWMCPICAAKISERRREELTRAITAVNRSNLPVYMATYTISHNRGDSLATLLKSFLKAHRSTKAGCMGQRLKQAYGIIGTVRALEITWGNGSGWHPHVHELIFTNNETIDETALEADLRHRWTLETSKQGLNVNQHGFKLDRTRGAIQDYIAKYGREPLHTPWGVEQELSKSHIKKGRTGERFTPFGLLLAINQGQEKLSLVFREYATYFKGKRQLTWSNGLKAMLLHEEEKTDEEIAAEVREEAILLGRLSLEQWRVVLANDSRGELLEVACSGDWQQVEQFLLEIGA